MSSFDLVIRGGMIVDGTGAAPFGGDVAIRDGVIVETGTVAGKGAREINADGALITPGYVDIHTHYDGQAVWDRHLAPSSWHGVTTAVMGNCGVGFAPVHAADHDRLIELMEGVEDIPGTALHEGLPWTWSSFPEYLDRVAEVPHDIDLGTQVPHAALRVHVMGDRGAQREPANADDIAEMARLTGEAIRAGALGFSTSRSLNHRSSTGERTPTLNAAFEELLGIAGALTDAQAGVLQIVSDFLEVDAEYDMLERVAAESGRPMSISMSQHVSAPNKWRDILDRMSRSTANGVPIKAQVAVRPIGILLGFDTTLNPFMFAPDWAALAALGPDERRRRLADPGQRQRLIDQAVVDRTNVQLGSRHINKFHMMYPLEDNPCYEPAKGSSVQAIADATGRRPEEVAYDVLAGRGGHGLLYQPVANFVDENLDAVHDQLLHPASMVGLSDGGAHVGTICDVSFPTTLLQWWGRDRPYNRIPIETLIHKQTQATAQAVGLADRGVLAPGYRADVNVIDLDQLQIKFPEIRYDLPAGGRRIVQDAQGYVHTFVRGVEIRANGEGTGAMPGQLIRGAQPAPR